MGSAESPDRKRRRHDSRERDRSRERAERKEYSRERSRERGSLRGRETEASTRPKQSDYDRTDRRDRPATTSGRNHHEDGARHEREQDGLHGRGAGSRQQGADPPRSTRDREHDSRRDRSRERQREQGKDRQQRGSDREREYERDRDRTRRDREDRSDRDRDRDRGNRDRDRTREDVDRPQDRGDRDRGGKDRDRDRADRDRDRGGYDRGGIRAADHRADHPSTYPSSRGREDRGTDRNRGSYPEQQQERAEPPHQREHSHRDSRPPERSGKQREQQEQDKDGKPKWGKPEDWAADEAPPPSAPKEGPNMGLSGKLAAETNKTADGTAELKFTAPAEARVCKKPVWKLFVYKGQDAVGDPISLTQLPFYMFGKDRKVADIPTDHPSCSRQHAVLVFREVEVDAADGIGYVRVVKPYLLDLETTNGTTINKEKLEPARYYELLSADVIRFGFSSRDYVIMNESAVQ